MQLRNIDGTLNGTVEELRRKIARNAKLASSECRGIADLSAAGIAHRDIKAANMVIFGGTKNTLAEVDAGLAHFAMIDLGIAQSRGKIIESGALQGTIGFMDPGGMLQSIPANKSGDVFAAAAVVAENLLGHTIGAALKRKSPILSYGLGEIKVTAYFSKEAVRAELATLRKELAEAGVPAPELEIYDRLADFAIHGLTPGPVARMKAFKSDPRSILRFDGHGVGPAFETRINSPSRT